MAMSAMHNSERFRCTAWETNLGHCADVQPTEATMPSTTVAERRISEIRPVARVKYHNAVPLWATAARVSVIGCSPPVQAPLRHLPAIPQPARCGLLGPPAGPGGAA